MNTRSPLAAFAAFALSLTPLVAAHAALPKGARAPDFSAQGALGGKPFSFNLKQALKRGPVVLYFYPKAFTQGCTLEAHAFADASADFAKAGATVVGMSNDDVATLTRFSTEACRDKFAVASATPALIKAYDVDLQQGGKSTGLTDRTSYVIAPDGKIIYAYQDSAPEKHIENTLAAVRQWREQHKP